MKRIAVIGPSGAGKSTVARQLAAMLHIPVIHLDAYYWQPGWTATPSETWQAKQEELVQAETWIIDGNYSSTLDIRLAKADIIIMLDYPRLLCLYRVLKRCLYYQGRTRPDLNEGCPERIDWKHLKWIWDYPKNGRARAMKAIERNKEGKRIVILHTATETKRFLEELAKISKSI